MCSPKQHTYIRARIDPAVTSGRSRGAGLCRVEAREGADECPLRRLSIPCGTFIT